MMKVVIPDEKMPFYKKVGVREMIRVERDSRAEAVPFADRRIHTRGVCVSPVNP